jgi:hypothetical protein
LAPTTLPVMTTRSRTRAPGGAGKQRQATSSGCQPGPRGSRGPAVCSQRRAVDHVLPSGAMELGCIVERRTDPTSQSRQSQPKEETETMVGQERPTVASTWQAVSGSPITDQLLEWPPDVFALTEVILGRSQAYRFLLSPHGPGEWPPDRLPGWSRAVEDDARQWSAWVEHRPGALPALVAKEWSVFCDRARMPLEQLAEGHDWRMCEALLTLHAIADEACAGLGVTVSRCEGKGCVYRARGRELLARTGSVARIHPQLLRVLPKVRTSPNGSSLGSFSRYGCVHHPGVDARWHKIPARHSGTDPRADHANILLLPWPLRVREIDFRPLPLEGTGQRMDDTLFGYFEFAPSERLDLDLVGRVIVAARDETGGVDVVALPESAVAEDDIDDLEALLEGLGVTMLITGVRGNSRTPGQLPGNWVHIGVSPRLEKGAPLPTSPGEAWFRLRQNKHHPWSLDDDQIYQYHLGGALHPHIRWGEAMVIPRRSLQFLELGEGITLVSLVCEDLAQIDDMAEVIRSVGPTGVVTLLLDGPQLTSRWAARYASVLADDPGSSVVTLTSFGMVQRCRPHGREPSRVIALWKDRTGGAREIPLEAGAQGVVLTMCGGRATRGTADGRLPADNATDWFDVAVHQVRASTMGSGSPARSERPDPPVLECEELTVLTGWAQALAEALLYAPERAPALLADARPGARWRVALGIEEPSPRLSQAIDSMGRVLRAAMPQGGTPTLDASLIAVRGQQPREARLDKLARQVLRSTLEQARYRREIDG